MRTLDSSENDLSCRESRPFARLMEPILPLTPLGQRFRPVSAQDQPLPPRIASLCSAAASGTEHQLRRHTEALDALQDRCEQLARHRHFGHLKRHVLGVTNHFGSDVDQLLPHRGHGHMLPMCGQNQPVDPHPGTSHARHGIRAVAQNALARHPTLASC